MTRLTRNIILIWIIILGLSNFVAYTVMYWYLQGDAKNGAIINGEYYVRGHFIHHPSGQLSEDVGKGWWIYSYMHSISIWPTVGAVLVAMFILARPHIIATMKSDATIRGGTFVTICITIVTLVTVVSTLYFILSFAGALGAINRGENWGI